ncbi:hypothetical protein ABH922_003477 [Rhodococcus sp. 27YEA15]|uniref:DUF3558 domain-containing protein n=1 Tax=Rhodococcus sp. 27YEA15 TaxID=3156259 RepID=UPI003C7D5439
MFGLVVWLVVGCGQVVEGTAERVSGQEGLFDPCADIPASAIESVGLDPTTAVVGTNGVEMTGQRICTWIDSWYSVGVISVPYSIEDIKATGKYVGFTEVQIGDRTGVELNYVDDPTPKRCIVAVPARQGSIWLEILTNLNHDPIEPTCPLALNYARMLLEQFPQ